MRSPAVDVVLSAGLPIDNLGLTVDLVLPLSLKQSTFNPKSLGSGLRLVSRFGTRLVPVYIRWHSFVCFDSISI